MGESVHAHQRIFVPARLPAPPSAPLTHKLCGEVVQRDDDQVLEEHSLERGRVIAQQGKRLDGEREGVVGGGKHREPCDVRLVGGLHSCSVQRGARQRLLIRHAKLALAGRGGAWRQWAAAAGSENNQPASQATCGADERNQGGQRGVLRQDSQHSVLAGRVGSSGWGLQGG